MIHARYHGEDVDGNEDAKHAALRLLFANPGARAEGQGDAGDKERYPADVERVGAGLLEAGNLRSEDEIKHKKWGVAAITCENEVEKNAARLFSAPTGLS